MLIDDIPSSVTYEYTGVRTFSINFPFYGTESIRMGFRESGAPTLAPYTELVKDVDFTVTGTRAGVGDSEIAFIAGEATLTDAGALKLSAGNIIVVYRDTPVTQLYAYNEYDNFPAKSHENALGRGIAIAQEQRERAERTLTLPPGSGSGAGVITAVLDAVDHAVEAADLAEQSAALSTTEADRAAAEADRALAEANRAETAVDGAIDAIVAEGDTQHARVLAEGNLQYTRVSAAGDLETLRVTDTGDSQVERILDMGVTLSTKGLGVLYGDGLTLQLTEPVTPTSVSVTASSTPSTRNFTYTAPDDDFLSPTALYNFACRVTGMNSGTFTFKAEYLLGTTLISSGEVSVSGQSTLLLGVPMNTNLLNEKLPYPAGTVLTVRLTITRSGSGSQAISLESSPLNPMTFTRNGGSVQASNVVDVFGGEQKTQAEINFILASLGGAMWRPGQKVELPGTKLYPNCVWPDRSLVLFADWPDLKAEYDAGYILTATEATATTYLGRFVLKADTTGLYLPDIGGLFPRAWRSGAMTYDIGRQAGSYQEDAMQRIQGVFTPGAHHTWVSSSGAFYVTPSTCARPNIGATYDGGTVYFDSARSTRIADETITKNYAQPMAIYLGRYKTEV